MAVNPLSLAESLRPWRYAGVFALLPGEGTEETLCLDLSDQHSWLAPSPDAPSYAAEPELAKTASKAAADENADFALSSPIPQKPASSSVSRKAPPPSEETNNAGRPPSSVPGPFTANSGHRDARREKRQSVQDRSLPEPWQAILSRTVPAPIIWTYAELGDDLAGRGDQERSACLRHIIGSLNLPKGSSAFWPVCLTRTIPTDDAPVSSSSPVSAGPGGINEDSDEKRFFQSGLRKLSPRVVILLGIQAVELSGLAVSLSTPFTQKIHKGILYVLLPDFPALLSKTVLLEQSCVFLRSALSGLTLI